MKPMWIAAPLLCFASAAMAGPEQQAVSGVLAELERAKASLMKEFAARGKAFPKTSEWEYKANSRDAPEVAYNSKAPTSASLIATITGTKNADLDVRHLGVFGTARPDGTVVWTCGTARSALRTSPSEETSMYPYLPPECRN
jgi:type IV pilus assembly protein PilA